MYIIYYFELIPKEKKCNKTKFNISIKETNENRTIQNKNYPLFHIQCIITECRIISRNWNLSTNFDQIQLSEVPYRKIRFCIKIKLQRIK